MEDRFIPLVMGFGCNVPAIMATRTIESSSDRMVTMMITPLDVVQREIPCLCAHHQCFLYEIPGNDTFCHLHVWYHPGSSCSCDLEKNPFPCTGDALCDGTYHPTGYLQRIIS